MFYYVLNRPVAANIGNKSKSGTYFGQFKQFLDGDQKIR